MALARLARRVACPPDARAVGVWLAAQAIPTSTASTSPAVGCPSGRIPASGSADNGSLEREVARWRSGVRRADRRCGRVGPGRTCRHRDSRCRPAGHAVLLVVVAGRAGARLPRSRGPGWRCDHHRDQGRGRRQCPRDGGSGRPHSRHHAAAPGRRRVTRMRCCSRRSCPSSTTSPRSASASSNGLTSSTVPGTDLVLETLGPTA